MAAALPPRGKRHKEQLSFSLRNNSVDIQLMPNLFPLCQTPAWTEPLCTSSPLSKPGKTTLENYTVWARSHFLGFMQCLELFCLRFWGLKRSPWKWKCYHHLLTLMLFKTQMYLFCGTQKGIFGEYPDYPFPYNEREWEISLSRSKMTNTFVYKNY